MGFLAANAVKLISHLLDIQKKQHYTINADISAIRRHFGTADLKNLAEKLDSEDHDSVLFRYGDYLLTQVTDLMLGRYSFEGAFFDEYTLKGYISSSLISEVKAHPEQFAAVLIDCQRKKIK